MASFNGDEDWLGLRNAPVPISNPQLEHIPTEVLVPAAEVPNADADDALNQCGELDEQSSNIQAADLDASMDHYIAQQEAQRQQQSKPQDGDREYSSSSDPVKSLVSSEKRPLSTPAQPSPAPKRQKNNSQQDDILLEPPLETLMTRPAAAVEHAAYNGLREPPLLVESKSAASLELPASAKRRLDATPNSGRGAAKKLRVDEPRVVMATIVSEAKPSSKVAATKLAQKALFSANQAKKQSASRPRKKKPKDEPPPPSREAVFKSMLLVKFKNTAHGGAVFTTTLKVDGPRLKGLIFQHLLRDAHGCAVNWERVLLSRWDSRPRGLAEDSVAGVAIASLVRRGGFFLEGDVDLDGYIKDFGDAFDQLPFTLMGNSISVDGSLPVTADSVTRLDTIRTSVVKQEVMLCRVLAVTAMRIALLLQCAQLRTFEEQDGIAPMCMLTRETESASAGAFCIGSLASAPTQYLEEELFNFFEAEEGDSQTALEQFPPGKRLWLQVGFTQWRGSKSGAAETLATLDARCTTALQALLTPPTETKKKRRPSRKKTADLPTSDARKKTTDLPTSDDESASDGDTSEDDEDKPIHPSPAKKPKRTPAVVARETVYVSDSEKAPVTPPRQKQRPVSDDEEVPMAPQETAKDKAKREAYEAKSLRTAQEVEKRLAKEGGVLQKRKRPTPTSPPPQQTPEETQLAAAKKKADTARRAAERAAEKKSAERLVASADLAWLFVNLSVNNKQRTRYVWDVSPSWSSNRHAELTPSHPDELEAEDDADASAGEEDLDLTRNDDEVADDNAADSEDSD